MNCMTTLMTTSRACNMGLANAVMVTQMPFSMDEITANKITGINARNARRTPNPVFMDTIVNFVLLVLSLLISWGVFLANQAISNQHPEWKSVRNAQRVRVAGLGAKNADSVPHK